MRTSATGQRLPKSVAVATHTPEVGSREPGSGSRDERVVVPDFDQLDAEDAAALNARLGDIRQAQMNIAAASTALSFAFRAASRHIDLRAVLKKAQDIQMHARALEAGLAELIGVGKRT